ncbi:putative mitochondrial protein [Tanacetum coccineum]
MNVNMARIREELIVTMQNAVVAALSGPGMDTIRRNYEGISRGVQPQFTRMTKIEFPSLEERMQFLKLMGENASWNSFKEAILLRFGNACDDPMVEIKNLRHVELAVRMFRPKSLAEVYNLSKILEAAIELNKQRYKPPLLPTPRFITYQHTQTPQNNAIVKQLSVPNTTLAAKIDIAGGAHLTSKYMCKKFAWKIHGEEFVVDVMLLPLRGYDMVLGVQWKVALREPKKPTLNMVSANTTKGFDEFCVQETEEAQSAFLHLKDAMTEEAQSAFLHLKDAMVNAPVLKLPNFNKEFIVETDASWVGIRVVLQQAGHPIAYMHHSLSTYEKELLAVIQALHKITTPAQMKWLPKLMGYDYEIMYKKGSNNGIVDALYRVNTSSQLLQMVLTSVSTDLLPKIVESWSIDHFLKTLIDNLKAGKPLSNQQLKRKGKLVIGNDPELILSLLTHFHCDSTGGHSSIVATTQRI